MTHYTCIVEPTRAEDIKSPSPVIANNGEWITPTESKPNILSLFESHGVLGSGTFGDVTLAKHKSGYCLALKRVAQDHRYINRELETLKLLKHPCMTRLAFYYYTDYGSEEETCKKSFDSDNSDVNTKGNPRFKRRGSKVHKTKDHRYLNLLLEYMPETVYRYVRRFVKTGLLPPKMDQKIIMWQFLRGVAYMHHLKFAHRDIKPQNLLIDADQFRVKICDFGSAKRIDGTEHSVSYICSRFYRAPELMLGYSQ